MTTYHLAERFAESVDRFGTEECLVAGRRRVTYAQVDAEAAALAAALRDLGVGPGDRVAVDLPNWGEWIITLFAVARLDAVLVPVN
ncbi:MAG: AMP-binding protein, partial [Gemmatimonadota bacterium]|nr:AMP-binding protein [Gemmatimonadota bacterium]